MKHQIYKITNKLNNKYYIGVHSGDIFEDNYYGSGTAIKHAIKKHGKDNFKREVITQFEDRVIAYMAEELVVDEDVVADEKSYNLSIGGLGGAGTMPNGEHTDEIRTKISLNTKKWWDGLTEEFKTDLIQKRKRYGDTNPNATAVIHIPTNTHYSTVTEAAEKNGISVTTLYRHLSGVYKHKNIYRYV